jgi:uncharacterized protein DUF4342
MKERWESFKVKGDQVVSEVRQFIHEGNVRRVVIKQGERTIAEFPLTIGVVGALAAPALAAVGALAALITDCTLHVQRSEGPKAAPEAKLTRRPRKKAGRKRQ